MAFGFFLEFLIMVGVYCGAFSASLLVLRFSRITPVSFCFLVLHTFGTFCKKRQALCGGWRKLFTS